MSSSLVLWICSLVHLVMHTSCFVDIQRFPADPNAAIADHIAYVTMLYVLYHLDPLPLCYRKRMWGIVAFLVELVLTMAIMELCIMCLWGKVVLFCYMGVDYALMQGNVTTQFYEEQLVPIVVFITTMLAIILLINAIIATNSVPYAQFPFTQVPSWAKKNQVQDLQKEDDALKD